MSFNNNTFSEVVLKLNKFPYLKNLNCKLLLKDINFFSGIPSEEIVKLADFIIVNEFDDGDVVCRDGMFSDFFHIILSGNASAKISTEDDSNYEIYSLSSGEFFGEELILSNEPRDNSVVVSGSLLTLSIDKKTFQTLSGLSENIMEELNQKYIERKLKHDLRKIPMFTNMEKLLFDQVLRSVEIVTYEDGAAIFDEGDEGDAFYLIRGGEVDVYMMSNRLIAILGEGQFFGEMALLSSDKRNATVKTSKGCDLVRLSQQSFNSIVTQDSKMMDEVVNVCNNRLKGHAKLLDNPNLPFINRSILDLNIKINHHLNILSQCIVETRHGSALLATLPGSRYPYVYPRDSASASRFLLRLVSSSLKSGDIAFRLLKGIATYILNCQREDGYWGQRYGINIEDKGIYKQEDNVAHGVSILCRYLLAAKKKNIKVSNYKEMIEGIKKGSMFAIKNYYRNEIHLFYSTTSIHESAIEEGYSIWVNHSYLLMLNLIQDVVIEFKIKNEFEEQLDLKKGFQTTIESVFSHSNRLVRRLKPDGEVDLRPDITLLSPFFFGTGLNNDRFVTNDRFKQSVDFLEATLWDPELGMLQRYLPFIEDPDTHIHAGNGPWIQYTAILAQYYFYIGEIEKGDKIITFIDKYLSKEGYLCEHLTTAERFNEFDKLEWIPGRDYEKEFDAKILIPGITYNHIVEELNHMKKSYEEVANQCKNIKSGEYITFATPLMWSHAEYAMALMLRNEKEIERLEKR